MTIALDINSFRDTFDVFGSEAQYSTAKITLQWDIATCYVSDIDYGRLNGKCRERAIQMMTAHLLTLSEMIENGDTPGQVTASTIDKVSVTLQPPPHGDDQWSWWLNLTPYGAQLEALLASTSVGGFYVGGRPERRGFRKIGGVF